MLCIRDVACIVQRCFALWNRMDCSIIMLNSVHGMWRFFFCSIGVHRGISSDDCAGHNVDKKHWMRIAAVCIALPTRLPLRSDTSRCFLSCGIFGPMGPHWIYVLAVAVAVAFAVAVPIDVAFAVAVVVASAVVAGIGFVVHVAAAVAVGVPSVVGVAVAVAAAIAALPLRCFVVVRMVAT